MTPPRLRTTTLAVLVAGALGTLAALAYSGGANLFRGGGIGFVLWALLPYAVLGLGLSRFWSRPARLAGLAGAVVIVAGAAALYTDAIWIHPDAQSGLAFVFVPVVQFAAVLLTVGLAYVLHRQSAA